MSVRHLVRTTLLVTGLTAVALLGACSEAAQPASLMALRAESTTTPTAQVADRVVTARVLRALLADPTINRFDLQAETRNGTVQLSGLVDHQAQIARALAITHAVAGVKTVENAVTLKGSPSTLGTQIDDATVTGRVKTVLVADPDIRRFDISVVTFKGEVQLTGFVNSQRKIDLAAQLAGDTEGATSVKNELMVKQQ